MAEFNGASDKVTTTVNEGKQATSIHITPQSYYEMYQGRLKAFNATAVYTDGSQSDVTNNSEWRSSNQWAATVASGNASAGEVIANNPGEASISAFYQSVSSKTDVKVLKVYPVSLIIVPDTVSVTTHATAEVKAMATMNTGDTCNYTNKVIWSSDNFNIATVESGVVQGQSPGSTTIRANFETVNASVPVTVTDITTTTP